MPFLFTMPKLSPTMEEGAITKWHKKEGEFVQAGEVLLEIATDKATVEHAAIDEGWLRKILIPEGKNAKINQPLALFSETKDESIEGHIPSGEVPKKEEKREAAAAPQSAEKTISRAHPLFVPEPPLKEYPMEQLEQKREPRLKASPLAKKVAKEKNLDLTSVKGTGPGGRITEADLSNAQPKGLVPLGPGELPQEAAGSYEEIELTPIRKVIGRRLQESKSFIPHFYTKQVVDAEELNKLREQLKHLNIKLTINDLVIRAVALALRRHPEINSGFNSQNETIIRFKTVDIAVAVTFEAGLITPIIRFADYKNLVQLSAEVRELAALGKQGKLKEHEYKGGSFTVSNLGMFGITEFSAVINPPQAAILAVGGIESKPVVKAGLVVPGQTLTLVLSADHRVIDGSQAAKFMKTLQELLENPVGLTL